MKETNLVGVVRSSVGSFDYLWMALVSGRRRRRLVVASDCFFYRELSSCEGVMRPSEPTSTQTC